LDCHWSHWPGRLVNRRGEWLFSRRARYPCRRAHQPISVLRSTGVPHLWGVGVFLWARYPLFLGGWVFSFGLGTPVGTVRANPFPGRAVGSSTTAMPGSAVCGLGTRWSHWLGIGASVSSVLQTLDSRNDTMVARNHFVPGYALGARTTPFPCHALQGFLTQKTHPPVTLQEDYA